MISTKFILMKRQRQLLRKRVLSLKNATRRATAAGGVTSKDYGISDDLKKFGGVRRSCEIDRKRSARSFQTRLPPPVTAKLIIESKPPSE